MVRSGWDGVKSGQGAIFFGILWVGELWLSCSGGTCYYMTVPVRGYTEVGLGGTGGLGVCL